MTMKMIPFWMGWLIIAIIFLLIELIHPYWILFWFAIGSALAAALSSQLSFNNQILLFLATSFSLVYIGRPIVTKIILPDKKYTNIEAYIGREEQVIEDIDNYKKTGAIKIYGSHWNAKSANDKTVIKSGARVKIVRFSGLAAIVEPVEKGEEK